MIARLSSSRPVITNDRATRATTARPSVADAANDPASQRLILERSPRRPNANVMMDHGADGSAAGKAGGPAPS